MHASNGPCARALVVLQLPPWGWQQRKMGEDGAAAAIGDATGG